MHTEKIPQQIYANKSGTQDSFRWCRAPNSIEFQIYIPIFPEAEELGISRSIFHEKTGFPLKIALDWLGVIIQLLINSNKRFYSMI